MHPLSLSSFSALPARASTAVSTCSLPGDLAPEQARELALRAWLSQDNHGSIAHLARAFDVSRYSVRSYRQAFAQHFDTLFSPRHPSSRSVHITVDQEHVTRTVMLARAELPVSIRNIQILLSIFYGVSVGFGTVWNTIHQIEACAKAWLEQLQLKMVKVIALDELYSQGMWVLTVIDVRTQTLCGLKVVEHRSKDDWNALLIQLRDKQGLCPEIVVSDAGTSVTASAQHVFKGARHQRDIFHAKQEVIELLSFLERRAYAALSSYYRLQAQRSQLGKKSRQAFAQQLRRLREETDRHIALHDRVLLLTRRLFAALEFIDISTGTLRLGRDAAAELNDIARLLRREQHPRVRKVGTYLLNQLEPLSIYMDALNARLMALANNIDELGCVLTFASIFRIERERQTRLFAWNSSSLLVQRNALLDDLCHFEVQPARLLELARETSRAIHESGRASSIVECFNSVQRQALQIHKRAREGALFLLATRWNLRQRSSGLLADSCPYTALTGKPVEDWLAVLQSTKEAPPAPADPKFTLLGPHDEPGESRDSACDLSLLAA